LSDRSRSTDSSQQQEQQAGAGIIGQLLFDSYQLSFTPDLKSDLKMQVVNAIDN